MTQQRSTHDIMIACESETLTHDNNFAGEH